MNELRTILQSDDALIFVLLVIAHAVVIFGTLLWALPEAGRRVLRLRDKDK